MQNVLRLRKHSSYYSEMDDRIETKFYIETFELRFFIVLILKLSRKKYENIF